ncbi:MAG: hypothetical protein AB7R87_11505 [Parvibaculaceae bacterium]
MSTTNPPSDLHLAMQNWHAALARNELEAQIAARLLVDILVAGGLDERIEEVTRPASHETGPVLPLLRHANRLTRDLGHLAACQLATANQLDRTLASHAASPMPPPTQPSSVARAPRLQTILRLNLAALLFLLMMAACAGFLLGVKLASRPLPPPFPFELLVPPPPAPPAPTPPADRINAAFAPPAPAAPPAKSSPS